MQCCSRSTSGVIIGVFSLLIDIFAIIGLSALLKEEKYEDDHTQAVLITMLIFTVISTSIPILLIVGIIKKRHKLMVPWLLVVGLGFIGHCARSLFTTIFAIVLGLNIGAVISMILVQLLGIALVYFILETIYILFKDIRNDNADAKGIVYSVPPVKPYPESPPPNYYAVAQMPAEKV